MSTYSLYKPVIAVVGTKKTGKTLAVEALVHGLSAKGYRVATAKHIPESDFTIDREGADTWRHARAGAKVVVSVSPTELAVIKRTATGSMNLARIVMECGEDVDLLILEGFKKIVEHDPRVWKLVAVKNAEEANEASRRFSPILAYIALTPIEEKPQTFNFIRLPEEKERLIQLVHEKVTENMSRSRPFKRTNIVIDGEIVPSKPFVQEIVRKTVLAMISTLKGVEIKGDEEVHVTIRTKKE